ncbi:hypothetical protein JW710_03875 [Candidatus Dojkabacteria bacterium]|nr:hypothetical protein [Candidatus Dojkabacteria bacterium]
MYRLVSPAYAAARQLSDLPDMVVGVVNSLWPFVGVILLFMFIYGGAMWLMSSGDPQKLAKAQGTLLWAVIGTVVVALVMAIMALLERVLGLETGFGPFGEFSF